MQNFKLPEKAEFPAHICGPCEVALREAILFRERIIRTQQLLLNSHNVADALQEIDLDEVEILDQREDEVQEQEEHKEPTKEVKSSLENVEVYDYADDEYEYEALDQSNELIEDAQHNEEEQPAEAVKEEVSAPPPHEDNLGSMTNKPVSTIYTKVNFAINAKNTPRINWSRLTEDEIVSLKRERRKRDCICEQCGRHFSCPSNFKVHLLRHTGIKNFACKECPMKFYTPHLLRRHMYAHLCEKPYPCQYCGQTFADHSGRIQHERK